MCLRHDRASTNLWICSTYKSRNQTVPLFTNVAASVSPSRCKRAHLDRSSWLLDSICLPPVSFFFPPSPSLKGSLPARAGAGEGGGERRRAKFQPSSGSPWAEWKELSFVGTGARHSRTNALSHGTSSSSLETPVCCGLHLECSRQPVHRSPARRWRTRAQRRWGIVPSAWNFWTVDGGHQSARLVSLFSFFSLFFFSSSRSGATRFRRAQGGRGWCRYTENTFEIYTRSGSYRSNEQQLHGTEDQHRGIKQMALRVIRIN